MPGPAVSVEGCRQVEAQLRAKTMNRAQPPPASSHLGTPEPVPDSVGVPHAIRDATLLRLSRTRRVVFEMANSALKATHPGLGIEDHHLLLEVYREAGYPKLSSRRLKALRVALVTGSSGELAPAASKPVRVAAVSVREAAARLNCSRRTIWNLIAAGRLPKVRVSPRMVRIPEQAIECFLADNVQPVAATTVTREEVA